MSDAYCFEGLAIECDSSYPPRLTIDGQKIDVVYEEGRFRALKLDSSRLAGIDGKTLLEVGERIIRERPEYQKRKEINIEHMRILSKGAEGWNAWRREHPAVRPMLYGADLRGIGSLERPNFSNANLIKADFSGIELIEPNFHEANLGGAQLCRTRLVKANFCRTDLYETNLYRAKLIEANLQGTQLAKTDFRKATLKNCRIYGMAAWDLKLEGAKQQNHIIKYRYSAESSEAEITLDDLQVAQFIYLMLHNERIKTVLDTINSKVVLILGRFTPERKEVLDRLRQALRAENLLPVIFDFERPSGRTLTETIVTLASLSRFIIVDITTPRSSPLELQATVPLFQIPFVPIIDSSVSEKDAFAMFWDLQAAFGGPGGRMLRLLKYPSADVLLRVVRPAIIERAQQLADLLAESKNEPLRTVDAESFLEGQV